jgi:hypothetical protein
MSVARVIEAVALPATGIDLDCGKYFARCGIVPSAGFPD